MPRKLKVYRTPIGFHDAYVAATSRKAALAAWGSDADLFARGGAEEVTDPSLMADALADPGKVVRKLRGTADEHLAALPPDAAAMKPRRRSRAARPSPPATTQAPEPRPSRDDLDALDAAIAAEERRNQDRRRVIPGRIAQLENERSEQEREHRETMATLDRERTVAEAAYAAALKRWRS